CGGNDAVLAALSAGLKEPGEMVDIAGTCEIISICLDEPRGSSNYNIRSHVIPDRWVTLFVLNTGGKALEWFHSVFCREMTVDEYYQQYLPEVIEGFLHDPEIDRRDAALPEYIPYLQGSRYSLEPLKAGFDGFSLETTRETFLLCMLKGNFKYMRGHLEEVAEFMTLQQKMVTTGGGAIIQGMNALKARWMGEYDYEYQEQSSLLGATMLGNYYLTNRFG
ncbi:MAG TPA: hypothetical protein VKA68_08360, partial [bacterium]|nr:hypothetical protein [bacterium]